MEKFDEKPKNSEDLGTRHINKIPGEIVGRFLQHLSVADRKECEGVSPRWKRVLSKMGWIEQTKLNRSIVFEGKSEEEIARFWKNSKEEGVCNLFVSLFDSVRQTLVELDLHSFGVENLKPFLPEIAKSIQHCSKLERISVRDFDLRAFVDYLPRTLRVLKTSKGIIIECLQTLSFRCLNLEDVPFKHLQRDNNFKLYKLIKLIAKFPRQKKLNFRDFSFRGIFGKHGLYSSIGKLNELVHLELWCCSSVDGKSFEAIVEGCQNLEFLSLDVGHLTEQTLFQLANIPKLSALEIKDPNETFTDAVLQAIAHRGQLRRLWLGLAEKGSPVTDDAVVYLVRRCKISKRSLKAVIVEVKRRHGVPPRSLPTGPRDPGIFYFYVYEMTTSFVKGMVGYYQWLRIGSDYQESEEDDY